MHSSRVTMVAPFNIYCSTFIYKTTGDSHFVSSPRDDHIIQCSKILWNSLNTDNSSFLLPHSDCILNPHALETPLIGDSQSFAVTLCEMSLKLETRMKGTIDQIIIESFRH